MRIKDLATRATKLLTGNAYMVVDNGTKVEKVNYAELAKQIITEYNTQTLAGSAQTVKSAIDALDSKFIYSTSKADFVSKIQNLPNDTAFTFFAAGTTMKDLTGDSTLTSNIKGTGAKTSNYFDIVFGYYKSFIYIGRYTFNDGSFEYYKQPTRAEVDKIKTTEHPNITDVLTPAQDVTILHSYVSVRNGLVILDCHFSQTSTTKTDRFTFKTGYKPIVLNTNIAPVFMYSNNVVSDSVLFVNPSTLTIFGANPVANLEYYFRLVYFNE